MDFNVSLCFREDSRPEESPLLGQTVSHYKIVEKMGEFGNGRSISGPRAGALVTRPSSPNQAWSIIVIIVVAIIENYPLFRYHLHAGRLGNRLEGASEVGGSVDCENIYGGGTL